MSRSFKECSVSIYFKFIKSQFKILICVVSLERLIMLGVYDEGNMSRGTIYCIFAAERAKRISSNIIRI